jgi:hypothetical protein
VRILLRKMDALRESDGWLMGGRRMRFTGKMGGGRFFPTTRKKSIETRKKIN